ncbi:MULTISPECIES: hypothetical protein [unclassified Nocardioides]|uniref:hypothetical protein n=1 Tax=unclassified Nocardioides TaxID=2615069 RepID=UPI00361042B2
MTEPDSGSEPSVSVRRAADLLGYASRSTVYARIARGDLDARLDGFGHATVTLASIERYRAAPPAGSWLRPVLHEDEPSGEPASSSFSSASQLDSLHAENMRLREAVSRLQMVREKESAARVAEAKANRHLRRALKERGKAAELSSSALADMDELLTLFLTPDNAAGAE